MTECLFSEGSARTGQAVEQAFNKLTQTVIYKIDSGEINEESLSTQKRTSGNDSTNLSLPEYAKGGAGQGGGCTGNYCTTM